MYIETLAAALLRERLDTDRTGNIVDPAAQDGLGSDDDTASERADEPDEVAGHVSAVGHQRLDVSTDVSSRQARTLVAGMEAVLDGLVGTCVALGSDDATVGWFIE